MKQRLRQAIALLVAGVGVINLWSATLPALGARKVLLTPFLPVPVRHVSHLAAAFFGFLLLLLAQGLWRRKRMAWRIAVVVLPLSALAHLLKGLDWEEAALATLVSLVLWRLRTEFMARSDEPTVRRGLAVLGVAVLATLGYGTLGFWLLDSHYKIDFGFRDALLETLTMFTEQSDPGLVPITRYGAWFADSIYFLGVGTVGYAVLALLRPVLYRGPATTADRARAQAIVEAHGRSSLARFALFSDKNFWFSPGGSVVAYTVVGRTALVLGDPMGPRDDAALTIQGFRAFCQGHDWRAAFYQTLPDYLAEYQTAGFEALCIGSEAVVDLPSFTLAGGPRKSLRQQVRRVEESGVRIEIQLPPFSPKLLQELRAVSDTWLATRHGVEKQFSLGWFEEEYLQEGPLALAYDAESKLVGFANIIPEYQLSESSIDLMRRIEDAPPGVMDLLFVTLFSWAREAGFQSFNLGLAPLSGVGTKDSDPAIERAVGLLYNHLNQFYNFKGLHGFKEKFRPTWEPRFLIYSHPSELPTVAYAIVRANNGTTPWWQFLRR